MNKLLSALSSPVIVSQKTGFQGPSFIPGPTVSAEQIVSAVSTDHIEGRGERTEWRGISPCPLRQVNRAG